MRSRCLLVAAATGLLAAAGFAQGSPALSAAEGWWILDGLPGVLADEQIQEHLHSGLTTSFHLVADPGSGSEPGVARIEIRYLLWDEAFQTKLYGGDGTVVEKQLPTHDALLEWWRELRVVILPGSARVQQPRSLSVSLEVLPFSAREEEDTRRWLSEVLSRRDQDPQLTPRSDRGSLGQVFGVLIATSIRRKAVRSYEWTVVPGPPGGESP